MDERRIIGLDLGIASEHTARVLSGEGKVVAKRKAVPTIESLSALEAAALEGAPPETVLEVVMEPTGPAWLPIAVFFISRGHKVFRVPSAKAHDMRRYFSRHAKSNSIDADALAKLAIIDPDGLRLLELNGADEAALDRRVRACDRLTQDASLHKVRLKDLVRQLLPMTPLTGDIGAADLAVLERWADPHDLVKAGKARLTRVIAADSHGHRRPGAPKSGWPQPRLPSSSMASTPASPSPTWRPRWPPKCDFSRTIEAELASHEKAREDRYRSVDPRDGPQPAGHQDGGRSRTGGDHGTSGAVPDRGPLPLLHGPRPQGVRDGQHRPQGPGHVQGRQRAPTHHADPCCGLGQESRTPNWPGSTTCR